jgi:hypothetical protein
MWVNLGVGISSSLIAAAIVYWVTERRLIPALVLGGAGLAGFAITWLLSRSQSASLARASSVSLENKQEFNPHFNPQFNPQFTVSVGNSSASAASVPTPTPEPKERHNIHFTSVFLATLGSMMGHTAPCMTAIFENQDIEGEQLEKPTVRARAIFRRPDGGLILDLSDVAWMPDHNVYATLTVNTPRHLFLFFFDGDRLWARSARVVGTSIGGMRRRIRGQYDSHVLDGPVGSVEIHLLKDTEAPYKVKLKFEDEQPNSPLPKFTSFTEL